MLEQHPSYPWIYAGPTENGFVGECRACGAAFVMEERDAYAFAAEHAEHQRAAGFGLGDAVHSVAAFLGFEKPCTPCEQRRVQMNSWFR